jgi:hypothetical protein
MLSQVLKTPPSLSSPGESLCLWGSPSYGGPSFSAFTTEPGLRPEPFGARDYSPVNSGLEGGKGPHGLPLPTQHKVHILLNEC